MTRDEKKELEKLVRLAFEEWLKDDYWVAHRDLLALIKAYEEVRK